MKAQINPTTVHSGGQYPHLPGKPLLTQIQNRPKLRKCGTNRYPHEKRVGNNNYVIYLTDYTEDMYYAHICGYYMGLKVCNIGL
jgi:hypothetical protein